MKKFLVSSVTVLGLVGMNKIASAGEIQTLSDVSAVRALLKAERAHLEEMAPFSDSMSVTIENLGDRSDSGHTVTAKIFTYHGVQLVGGDVAVGSKTLKVRESCHLWGGFGFSCSYKSEIIPPEGQ